MRKEKGSEAGAFSASERMIETIREILENEELDERVSDHERRIGILENK